MNRGVWLALLSFLVPGCSPGGARNSQTEASIAATLLAQEGAWTEAFKYRDRTTLSKLLADDFVFTDDGGNVYNKAEYIAAVIKVIRVPSYKVDSTTVLTHGDVGVVAGRWAGTMTIDGKDASGSFRFTDTFLRGPGGWQVIASQDTRIPSPSPKCASGLTSA